MICQKSFTLNVALPCDTFEEATWTETILDPDDTAVFSMDGGDGSFFVALTGSPGHQGALYRYVSNVMTCSVGYTATIEIDYDINLSDVGAGSNAVAQWSVTRNGASLILTTKSAPNGGTLIESGTIQSGPFTMLADTNYTFQIEYTFSAIGVGTTSDVSGVIRFRPLTPP